MLLYPCPLIFYKIKIKNKQVLKNKSTTIEKKMTACFNTNYCQFTAISKHCDKCAPVLQLLPICFHNSIFLCTHHCQIHVCHTDSKQCQITHFDAEHYGKCLFTGKINKYKMGIVNPVTKSNSDFGKKCKSRNQVKRDIKWTQKGIPTPYEYQTFILDYLYQNNLNIIAEEKKVNSAIHRTYDFFLAHSKPGMCQDHLQIIGSSFFELFSKSSVPCDEFKSSDFKTQIKFIISMEILGKVKPAKPLFIEPGYVRKRKIKLQAMGKKKYKQDRWT